MECTQTSSNSTDDWTVPADWWEEERYAGAWHDVHRLRWTPSDLRETAARIEGYLRLAPGSNVLDLACGLGGLSRMVASRGHHVVGVDRDPSAVAAARSAPAHGTGGRLDFAVGDMRDLPHIEGFDGAYCWWGSFGYFDDAGDRATATSLRRAVRPRGRVVVEVLTFEGLIPAFESRTWVHGGGGGGPSLMQSARVDVGRSRLELDWTLVGKGPAKQRQLSIRVYSVREVVRLLQSVGFDDVRAVFDPEGEPVQIRPQGGRTVFVAQRAG